MGQFAALATGIAGFAIVMVVTFLIMSQARTQIGTTEGVNCNTFNSTEAFTSASCNATATLQAAVATIPGWVPLIVIASVGAALLGLVAMFRR